MSVAAAAPATAATPPPVNFGEELKDAFKPVNAWVANGIAWLDDVQAFYRERATIEKEYAGKLNALSRRFYDKKNKKSASLTVGDSPLLTPGSLESASLMTWTTILTTTEALASEHDALAGALAGQVADALRSLGGRYDDYRRRYEALANRLAAERDGVYADLKKTKAAYDAACREVEDRRLKADRSNDAAKPKAQRAFRAELGEMNNLKNCYLLQIEVANRHKQRYFHEDLPEVINSLQDLNETRVTKLNSLWTLGSTLETACHQRSNGLLATQISEIARNLPVLDSGMFVKHNAVATIWAEPPGFVFEPCPIWHDNADLAVADEPARIYLRNQLHKSRRGLDALRAEVDRRGHEIAALAECWDALKLDEGQAQKESDAARSLIYMQEEILPHASRLLTAQVTVDTILAAVGDEARGAQSHNFRSASFKIPTNCDMCGDRIWGLASKGCTCADCGYACHAKCEMKVPAACPGVLDKAAKKALRDEKKDKDKDKDKDRDKDNDKGATDGSSVLTRASTVNSTSSLATTKRLALSRSSSSALTRSPSSGAASAAPAAAAAAAVAAAAAPKPTPAPTRRIVAPPPERYISAPPAPSPSPPSTPASSIAAGETAKMLYDFTATGAGELQVSEGDTVTILEDDGDGDGDDDDGDGGSGGGWTTVRRADGATGIVPTSYVQRTTPRQQKATAPALSLATAAPTPAPAPTPTPAPAPTLATKKRGPPPLVRPRGTGVGKQKKVRALYAYVPTGDDEVAMQAGDEFVVVERDEGGWVRVKTPGGDALVPGTYVEDV